MDFIEGLISLGSVTVDYLIASSKTCSNNKQLTPEGRAYFKELNKALTVAKSDINEYKKKRDDSAFKKLKAVEEHNSKFSTRRNGEDIIKINNLIEAHFGGYRGQKFEDKEVGLFHFFDVDCPIITALLHYVKEPCSGENFDIFPLLAMGITQNVWSGLSRTFKINRFNFMVFCVEGIAFGCAANSSKYAVIPYADIETVYRYEKHTSGFFGVDVSELYFKPKYNHKQIDYPYFKFTSSLSEGTKKLIANSMYNFIRCFNPECKYEEKKKG